MRRNKLNPFVPYTDLITLLFGWAMIINCLLLITAHLVVQKNDVSKVKPDGQYLITLTWDDNRDVDLDLWVQDPLNDVIYYNNREAKNISLDRDSRGFATNETILPGGQKVFSGNREIVTIRGIIPGNYLVAVSYYGGTDGKGNPYPFGPWATTDDPAVAISYTVKVIKLNPDYTEAFGQQFHFTRVKEAQNIVDFRINDDGTISIQPLPSGNLPYEHGAGDTSQ